MIERTASVTFHIVAECEACAHRYEWDVQVTNTTSSAWYGYARDPTPGMMRKVNEYVGSTRWGVRPCPQCGYVQSWMYADWVTRNQIISAVCAIPLFIVVGFLLGWPMNEKGSHITLGYLIGRVAALAGYAMLLVLLTIPVYVAGKKLWFKAGPNKAWHEKHGPSIPAEKLPTVMPLAPASE